MTKWISILAMILLFIPSVGHSKTRVAVSAFKDKTGKGRCQTGLFGTELSQGFKDQLTTALYKTRKVKIVERENLANMYQEEHKLINADESTLPQAKKFKAAHYSVTGAITQFELCSTGVKSKVDVGGLFGFKISGLKVGGLKKTKKKF